MSGWCHGLAVYGAHVNDVSLNLVLITNLPHHFLSFIQSSKNKVNSKVNLQVNMNVIMIYKMY